MLPFLSKKKIVMKKIADKLSAFQKKLQELNYTVYDCYSIFLDKDIDTYIVSNYDMHPNKLANQYIFNNLIFNHIFEKEIILDLIKVPGL